MKKYLSILAALLLFLFAAVDLSIVSAVEKGVITPPDSDGGGCRAWGLHLDQDPGRWDQGQRQVRGLQHHNRWRAQFQADRGYPPAAGLEIRLGYPMDDQHPRPQRSLSGFDRDA